MGCDVCNGFGWTYRTMRGEEGEDTVVMAACFCSYGQTWAEAQSRCPECGDVRTETSPDGILYCTCQDEEEDRPDCPQCDTAGVEDNGVFVYCPACKKTTDLETGLLIQGDDEEDRPDCPECGGTDTSADDFYNPDRYLLCGGCGTVFDPESRESVEDWSVDLYCELEGYTKSDAEAYIYDVLDQIHRATGFRIIYDKMT